MTLSKDSRTRPARAEALRVPPEASDLLACIKCGATPLPRKENAFSCSRCDWSARVVDGVIDTLGQNVIADFDDLHQTMQENNATDIISQLMYQRQSALVESVMRSGAVVLDIGCGPSLPYKKPPGVFLIGLEPSMQSIRINSELDLAICGSATELPLRDNSVDLAMCFYSVHHMVGDRIPQTVANVNKAFGEFARVLKPNGTLLVFEVCTWQVFSIAQTMLWQLFRNKFGTAINFYFWRKDALGKLAERHLPTASHSTVAYRCSPFVVFPPIFAWQWLRVPRFCYPFNVIAMRWDKSKC